VRNPTTWFQLGVTRDAGPEIVNGLGAFLYAARFKPGFGQAFSSASLYGRWPNTIAKRMFGSCPIY
jgi:hypothetical protein